MADPSPDEAALEAALGPAPADTPWLWGGDFVTRLLGGVGQLPGGATMQRIFGDPGMQTPQSPEALATELDREQALRGVDTSGEVPIDARMAVVSAAKPEDQLAALRKIYPDAAPIPGVENNWTFTNAAGRRQTYRPMGLHVPTAGDLASLTPEGAELLGGLVGGGAGSIVSPVLGTAIGAGVGAAAAREGVMRFLRSQLGVEDTRTPLQTATDVGVTGAVNAAGPLVGGGLNAARAAMTPTTATQQAAAALRSTLGMPDLLGRMPASVAAESPAAGRIEAMASQLPFSGPLIDAREGVTTDLRTAAQTLADRAAGGAAPRPDAFAGNINDIARSAIDRWELGREAQDQVATSLVGATRPTDLTPLIQLRTQLAGQLARAPETQARALQPAIDRIDMLLHDATGAAGAAYPPMMPFDIVRQFRTNLGKVINFPDPAELSAEGVPAMEQVYGAAKDALTGAANAAGPNAARALADHDAMVASFRTGDSSPAKALGGLASDSTRGETIQRLMQSTAAGDQQALATITSPSFTTPAERGTIQGGVIGTLGEQAGQFEPGRFLSQYSRATDFGKDRVFGTTGTPLRDALDNLATVQASVRQAGAARGFSNTGAVLATFAALSAVGQRLYAGDPMGAIGVGASSIGMGQAAARLMTNPRFVNWLSGNFVAGPNTWPARLAQLTAIGAAEPTIRGEVNALRARLPETVSNPP